MNRSTKFQQIVRGMNQVGPETGVPASSRARPQALPTHRPHRCWTCR